jgi:hypothetical protein
LRIQEPAPLTSADRLDADSIATFITNIKLPFTGRSNTAFGFIPDDWIWYDDASSWLMSIGWNHQKSRFYVVVG